MNHHKWSNNEIVSTLILLLLIGLFCAFFSSWALDSPSGEKVPLVIGVLANRGNEIALAEWGSTAAYLNQQLAPLEFTILPLGFEEIFEAVKNNQVSYVIANPGYYVEMEFHGLATRIATMQVPAESGTQASFGGVIFTRAENQEIQELKDLKNKKFAAVNPSSFGGWQIGLGTLQEAGLNAPEIFRQLIFSGSHDAVVEAVLKGEADAGTVRSTQIERMIREGVLESDRIRILNDQSAAYPEYPYALSTPLYPEWPFAALRSTNPETNKAISIALLEMGESDPAALAASGAGWRIPQDYFVVHQLLKTLRLPPYENEGNITISQVFKQYWMYLLLAAFVFSLLIAGGYRLAVLNNENQRLANQYLMEKEKAIQANALKSMFLANMSHEIRTPMNGILGFVQLLEERSRETEQLKFINQIKQSSGMLLKIINDILDLSRVESGKWELERKPFRLSNVIENSRVLFEKEASQKGLILNAYVSEKTNRIFIGDPFRMQQIINNLLSNGIKFTESGSVSLFSEIAAESEDAVLLRIQVKDTGPGIPEEKQPLLFQPFMQLDSSTTKKHGGTGLGLAIVKSITELMGGTIALKSTPNKGSTFTVIVPLEICKELALESEMEEDKGEEKCSENIFVNPVKPETSLTNSQSQFPGKVLIVEDNEINQMFLQKVLDSQGISYTTAWNGREAVDLADKEDFALILMDMQMPVMDGYQAFLEIRKREKGTDRKARIIAVTAYAMKGDMEKCLSMGMDGYLSKPIQLQELIKILGDVESGIGYGENNG